MPCRPAYPICGHQLTRPVLGCYCHLIPLWAFWIYFLNSCFLLFILHILFKYNWIIRIIFEYSNLFRDLNIFESFLKSWIIFGFKNFLTSDSSKKKIRSSLSIIFKIIPDQWCDQHSEKGRDVYKCLILVESRNWRFHTVPHTGLDIDRLFGKNVHW